MNRTFHVIYTVCLFAAGFILIVGPAIHGASYYLTPLQERPFHPLHETLKPTGFLGHGYGIVGSFMIILGVAVYSGRKRIRWLASYGKLQYYLEFHIFLCLTGPILVLYHTTFRFSGIVAVSFWSMTAVVLSGLIGRYLYAQIPRGIQGQEVGLAELTSWHGQLADRLHDEFGLDTRVIRRIDALAAMPKHPSQMPLLQVLRYVIIGDLTRWTRLRALGGQLRRAGLKRAFVRRIVATARIRVILARRIALLERVRILFHHWHVIHFPFTIIMFAILGIHVAVALAFGYRWVF